MKNGETVYTLRGKLVYSKDGKHEEAGTLTLREPRIQHAQRALKLRQMVKKAEIEAATMLSGSGVISSEAIENAAAQMKGAAIPPVEKSAEEWGALTEKTFETDMMQLEMSSVDLYEFASLFWKMADMKPSVCLIDGVTPMKSGWRDDMDLEDFLNVPVWYCSFFVTLSASDRRNIFDALSGSA